jgi:hypothetical protein
MWMARVHHQLVNVRSINHSKRTDFILWYTIIANTDKAQCTIGVKLREHYHNGFLRPAFPMLIKGLASFGHPIQFYPS